MATVHSLPKNRLCETHLPLSDCEHIFMNIFTNLNFSQLAPLYINYFMYSLIYLSDKHPPNRVSSLERVYKFSSCITTHCYYYYIDYSRNVHILICKFSYALREDRQRLRHHDPHPRTLPWFRRFHSPSCPRYPVRPAPSQWLMGRHR